MVAPLNDLTLLKDHNGLGIADGGQTVGNDKDGTTLHQAIHAFFNHPLRPGVDGGGGLIQNQHRRIGTGRPGDVQKLPLPLAEIAAVIGNPGVIAFGQMADKGICAGQTGGRTDLLVGGIQFSVPDVIRYGSGKQVGILKNNAQASPQAVLTDIPYINAVIGDQTAFYLVKAIDQVGDRGFSGAGGTNESDLLARLGIETDAVENSLSRHIAEHHIVEPYIAP